MDAANIITLKKVETSARTYGPIADFYIELDQEYLIFVLNGIVTTKNDGQESVIEQHDEIPASSIVALNYWFDDNGEEELHKYVIDLYVTVFGNFPIHFKDKGEMLEAFEKIKNWWRENRKK